jgi:hypothetical protein
MPTRARVFDGRFLRLLRPEVVTLACFLTSCATPGPGEYADIAAHHAQQARRHNALAQQHEAAALNLARHGDGEGEEISQQAADEEARDARKEQFDADWDSWLSQWLPSPIISQH